MGLSEAHCVTCQAEDNAESGKITKFDDGIPKCGTDEGFIKPDIVFFGEGHPKRYHELTTQDIPKSDWRMVMGTSLTVHPFAGLVKMVNKDGIRVLINREKVGANQQGLEIIPQGYTILTKLGSPTERPEILPINIQKIDDKIPQWKNCFRIVETGFRLDKDDNKRDIFIQGDIDAGK